jgi:5-oxoprolinase (ATP-hydrolysing) subunit A
VRRERKQIQRSRQGHRDARGTLIYGVDRGTGRAGGLSIMPTMDLNSDMAEGFGAWRMGDDGAMLKLVTTANIACGFHASDPEIMASTMAAAKGGGVAVGAHPGFPDLWGFGRRRIPFSAGEITRLVAYQVGAAAGMAALVGHRITHVKPHGALGNIASEDTEVADAVAKGIGGVDPGLIILVTAGSELERVADRLDLPVAREIFADRAYVDSGNLMPRSQPGAVIHDAAEASRRVLAMADAGALITESGKRIPVRIDSVCVHGDTPGAVAIAAAVRGALEAAGYQLRPFASVRN